MRSIANKLCERYAMRVVNSSSDFSAKPPTFKIKIASEDGLGCVLENSGKGVSLEFYFSGRKGSICTTITHDKVQSLYIGKHTDAFIENLKDIKRKY